MAPTDPTLSAMGARLIVMALAARGASPPELCAKVGTSPEVLADVDGRVGVRAMIALWIEAERLTGDADFGVHLAEQAVAASPALPWYLLVASASLGEGLARIVALWRLFNDVHPPVLDVTADRSTLGMKTRGTPWPAPRHATEFAFAWFVGAARRATGVDVKPAEVAFEHDAPADPREVLRVFGCPVRFGAEAAALTFTAESLRLPTIARDPELADLLHRQAHAMLEKLPPSPGAPFSARVREVMTELLPSGDATIDRVAAELGTSARSVQRRLHEEGATFQALLDDLRRDLALTYLADRTCSLAEIALILGFSDQSAFHRAFVRWTGKTPGDVRRASR